MRVHTELRSVFLSPQTLYSSMSFFYASTMFLDALGLFLLLAGNVIGLGLVTVRDLLGFLGRGSGYWTEATIRSHKVTKPFIWYGILFALVGGGIFFRSSLFSGTHLELFVLHVFLLMERAFLSNRLSPFLFRQEQAGKSIKLLPSTLQAVIGRSLVLFFFGWWVSLVILVGALVNR